MRRKLGITLLLCAALASKMSAQTVVVTDDNTYTAGHASSVLDVKSTTRGFLAPRVTQAQRIAIVSPAEGLLVYQTDGVSGFYFYKSGSWTILASGTGGNQWTTSGTNIYYTTGNVGVGITNPTAPFTVKDTLEIRRTAAVSNLIFSNTGGTGDFRIAGDGGDLFWQGGGSRNLQMGAYWGVILAGDRQTGAFPAFSPGTANTGVLVLSQRDASVPLAVQANSATQAANLTEWRSSSSTLSVVDRNGNLGLGTTAPSSKLHVIGTNPLTLVGVQAGATTDSVLTIASGIVKKLPFTSVTGTSWSFTGNAGTSSGSHFLGTTDNSSLVFRSNNTRRMIVDSLGNVGIGTAPAFTAGTYQEKLLVDAGVTNSFNAIVARGSVNNYFQLNIQNQSAGVNASSDIVATADNGSETTNFIDMGINSSANTQAIMGAANDAYLYNLGNNLLIGTGSASKSLVFVTGGTLQSTNERMRIDGNGNVGIGVTAPTASLHIDAGTAAGGTAPVKLTAGTVMTTPEAGAVEFDGTNYFVTTGTTRYTLAKTLTSTASLNFPSTGASGTSTLTMTLNGAVDGDVISLGVPSACNSSNGLFSAYVSAANTVTVRFTNVNTLLSQDPPAGTFRVSVTRY